MQALPQSSRPNSRRPVLLAVSSLLLIYTVSVAQPIQRRLWFDELYTFYIAHAPTLSKLMSETYTMDTNPPLGYLATRYADWLLGPGDMAVRVPSVLAFFAGSLLLYAALARRIGGLWSGVAVLAFWSGEFFQYATEIRPYGLLFCFFGLAAFSLDRARQGKGRLPAAGGLALGIAGMLLSHMFGVLSAAPLFASELVRTVRRKHVDSLIWSVLVVPLGVAVISIPILRHFSTMTIPPTFAAGFHKLAVFYGKSAVAMAVPAGTCMAVICLYRLFRKTPPSAEAPAGRYAPWFAPEDAVFLGTLLMLPLLVNLIFMRTHSAFFDRYCITTGFALCVCCALGLRWLGRASELAGFACVAIFSAAVVYVNALSPAVHRAWARPYPVNVEQVMPDLPVVVVSGITFLEADHYADASFLKRMFYVTDPDGFARYAHASSFEGMAETKKVFPIRANVQPFSEFRKTHPRFLILGTPQHPEAWFLKKMMAEELVRKLGDFGSDYRDNSLFEVELRDR